MAERLEHDGFLETALGRAGPIAPMGQPLDEASSITYTEEVDSGRTFAISPQVETLLGYAQEEWMGDADLWVDRIHPEDRERVVRACEHANRAKEPYCTEYRILTRDGRIVWVHDEAVLIGGSEGQSLCWQGVMRVMAAAPAAVRSTLASRPP